MKKAIAVVAVIFVVLAVFAVWFSFAMDYGDHVVVGAYAMSNGGESCTLTLKADHSFHQERTYDGKTLVADGTWRRVGQGGLVFSSQFLILPGQEADPNGTTSYANVHKALGLFPSIVLSQYHVLWYGRTDPSTGTEVVGSYAGDEPDVSTQLTVKADHTFKQTWSKGNFTKDTVGTWNTIQNGDIQFSKEFLKTSGAPLTEAESASASNPKGSSLQIAVAVNPSLPKPVFRKRILGF